MAGVILLTVLVMGSFGFRFEAIFEAATRVQYTENGVTVTRDFLQPGLYYKAQYRTLNLISLSLALILGTAVLTLVLFRLYTFPTAPHPPTRLFWLLGVMGTFYFI